MSDEPQAKTLNTVFSLSIGKYQLSLAEVTDSGEAGEMIEKYVEGSND